MKYELEDELFTKLTNITGHHYEGRSIENKDGERVIQIPYTEIQSIIEDLVCEWSGIDEELTDALQPKEEPIVDPVRGNYY